MTWTTRTPTQPGFYWVTRQPPHGWVVFVYDAYAGLHVEDAGRCYRLSDFTNAKYWSSEPIKEPDNEL